MESSFVTVSKVRRWRKIVLKVPVMMCRSRGHVCGNAGIIDGAGVMSSRMRWSCLLQE